VGWESSGLFQVVIITGSSGSGLFVYSPTPSPGHLVASIAATGGVDPFGNLYLQGVTSYHPGGVPVLAAQLSDAQTTFWQAPSEAGPWTQLGTIGADSTSDIILAPAGVGAVKALGPLDANAGAVVTGGTTTDQTTISDSRGAAILLQVTNAVANTSPNVRVTNAAAADLWLSGIITGDSNGRLILDTTAGGAPRIRFGSGAVPPDCALLRGAANLFAADYIAFNNTGAAETWNAVTFANGWANAASGTAMQFRRVAAPDNCVEWVGRVTAPVGIVAGQAMITAVGVNYRAANVQSLMAFNLTTPGIVRLQVGTGGVVSYQSGAVAGDNIEIFAGNLVALTA
jgi:hypothetical protein